MDHSLANEPGGAMVAYRGAILHFRDDPRHADDSAAYFDDGLLVVQTGRVVACGEYRETLARMPGGIEVHDHRGHLIVPGFVDTHIHFAQTDIIASYGKNVLDWLERHTFPAERRFSDNGHAAEVAEFAVDEMLRNGTTPRWCCTAQGAHGSGLSRSRIPWRQHDRRQSVDGSKFLKDF
jgi:guanine deaminase